MRSTGKSDAIYHHLQNWLVIGILAGCVFLIGDYLVELRCKPSVDAWRGGFEDSWMGGSYDPAEPRRMDPRRGWRNEYRPRWNPETLAEWSADGLTFTYKFREDFREIQVDE